MANGANGSVDRKAGGNGGGLFWLVVALLGSVAVLWLVAGGSGTAQARVPDLAWPWHQQRVLVLAPVVELVLGYLGILALVGPATQEQLWRRVGYAWGASDDFAPADEDIAHAVHVLGTGLPREVQSTWRYPRAMATRIALIARPGGRVMIRVDVPAERAGTPILTALGMDGTTMTPWEEALAVQPWGAEPPGPSVAVPVEEMPEGGH